MKKWLVVVEDSQYDWLKKTAADVGISGSVVVRAIIEKARTVEAGDFKISLLESQIKDKIHALQEEKLKVDQELQTLKNKLTPGKKVVA